MITCRRVLVIEDDESVAYYVRSCLHSLGYDVNLQESGEHAVEATTRFAPDVVLVDVNLRGAIGGLETAQRIRRHSSTPVIFLSGYADLPTIAGLADVVADGYVVKPFKEFDLAASLHLTIRRAFHQMRPGITQIGGLHLDHVQRSIQCCGQNVYLTNKEFRILELLASSVNAPRSPESILASVWGQEFVHYVQALRVHIKNLRKKLGPDSGVTIEVLHGVGYRLVQTRGKAMKKAV